jgi:ABC-2 type transport system permease protein
VPVVVVFTVGSALIVDRTEVLPALLGASLGILLTAYGTASVVSAIVVYPVQLPGENPFQTRQGASMAAITSQLLGWLAVLVLSSPEVVLAVVAITLGPAAVGWIALLVGLVFGGTLLVVGLRVGGRTLDRTGTDLLARIQAFA